MPRVSLKGINTVRKRLKDGSVRTYYYCRGTGKRIQGTPGSPEFMAAFVQAAKFDSTDRGTFGSLLRSFASGPEFQRLADKTKKDYLRYIELLRVEFGDMPLATANNPRIRKVFFEWRDRIANTPRHADYAWSVLRRVLSWAHNRGMITANHAAQPGRLYAGDRAEIIWSDEQIERFKAVAPIELHWALFLALYTGQRQGDLLRLRWSDINGDHVRLTQRKGRRLVSIRVHEMLRSTLETIPKRQLTILTAPGGRPWKADHFRHLWRDATKQAGLDGLHFHDLRGTAVTRLAESECTPPEIAAISGHKINRVTSILERYLAPTEQLADSAIRKWENADRTNSANQLQTGSQKNGTGSA